MCLTVITAGGASTVLDIGYGCVVSLLNTQYTKLLHRIWYRKMYIKCLGQGQGNTSCYKHAKIKSIRYLRPPPENRRQKYYKTREFDLVKWRRKFSKYISVHRIKYSCCVTPHRSEASNSLISTMQHPNILKEERPSILHVLEQLVATDSSE